MTEVFLSGRSLCWAWKWALRAGFEVERILSGKVWWMRGFGFPQRAHRKCRKCGVGYRLSAFKATWWRVIWTRGASIQEPLP